MIYRSMRFASAIAVIAMVMVATAPTAEAGVFDMLKKLFSGSNDKTTEQSSNGSPQARSGDQNTSNTDTEKFSVAVNGQRYKNGDTIELEMGNTPTATVEWNVREGSSCAFVSNLGTKRLNAQGSFDQAAPGHSYDWKMICNYYDESLENTTQLLDAVVHFVVKDAIGGTISHADNRAQFAIFAQPQIITRGEETTIGWSTKPTLRNGKGQRVRDCKLEADDAEGGLRTIGAWSYEAMKNNGIDERNIFRVKVTPAKAGDVKFTLGCNYFLREPFEVEAHSSESVPISYAKTSITVRVSEASTGFGSTEGPADDSAGASAGEESNTGGSSVSPTEADPLVFTATPSGSVERGTDVTLLWKYFYVAQSCVPSGIGFTIDDIKREHPELVNGDNELVPRGSFTIKGIGSGTEEIVRVYYMKCQNGAAEKSIQIGITDDGTTGNETTTGDDTDTSTSDTGSGTGGGTTTGDGATDTDTDTSDTGGGSGAGSGSSDAAADATDEKLTFTVKGGTKLHDVFPVVVGVPFTLQWSTSANKVCTPSGSWSLNMVRGSDPSLVMDTLPFAGMFTPADDRLRPKGEYTVTLTESGPATFIVECTKRFDAMGWSAERESVTVKASPAGGDGSSTGGGAGTTTNGNTGADTTDDSASTQTPKHITAFTVTPDAIASDGNVNVSYTVAVPDQDLTCVLSGKRDEDANAKVLQTATYRDHNQNTTFTRSVALGDIVGDDIVHVQLACAVSDGVQDTQVRDVRVGATAGIRSFTASSFHLDEPGEVQLSWETFGMKSCEVKSKVLDSPSIFITSRNWRSPSDGTYYVRGTTQFELICQPQSDVAAVQRKTLTVSFGDYASNDAIAGTGSATGGVQYTNYCPFEVSSTHDRLANFSQRLEAEGQKEVVGVTIPAGTYSVWLSASDSFDQREDQDQSNERYYAEFYGADGEVVAKTESTDDIADGDGDNVATKVTMVADELELKEPIAQIAAVHADGDNASVNPGCILLKRLDPPAEDDAGAAANGATTGTDATAGGSTSTAGAAANGATTGNSAAATSGSATDAAATTGSEQDQAAATVSVTAPAGTVYREKSNAINAKSGDKYAIAWRGFLKKGASGVRRTCVVGVNGERVAGPSGEGTYEYTVGSDTATVKVVCDKEPWLFGLISQRETFITTFTVSAAGADTTTTGTDATAGGGTTTGATADDASGAASGPVRDTDFTFTVTSEDSSTSGRKNVRVVLEPLTEGTVCSVVSSDKAIEAHDIVSGSSQDVSSTISKTTTYTATCTKDGKSLTVTETVAVTPIYTARSLQQTLSSCKSRIPASARARFAPDSGISVACEGTTATATVNGDANTYTWHQAYYTTDGNAFSNATTVQGQRDATGKWIVGDATVTVPNNGNANYIATYSCKKSGTTWQCGCKDDGICSRPEVGSFIWNVAGFQGAVAQ